MIEPSKGTSSQASPVDRNADDLVDVVIVSFNTAVHLHRLLTSLRGISGLGRVIVVDNASTDDSKAVTESFGANWLPTGRNLGFGSAANRGVAAALREFVVVLNPDTVVEADLLVCLRDRLLQNPRVGLAGPAIRNPDGSIYPSARSFPSLVDAIGHATVGLITTNNPWTRRYRNPTTIDWISGTAMALRRTAFESVGGFDERYFMYVEDVDLCWRLRNAGWSVLYVPETAVTHTIGAASERAPYRMIVEHHRSLLRFEARTARGPRRLLLPLLAIAMAVRTVAAWTQRLVRQRPHAAA